MNCPECNAPTKVLDKRETKRRRACTKCPYRFNTYEITEFEYWGMKDGTNPNQPRII